MRKTKIETTLASSQTAKRIIWPEGNQPFCNNDYWYWCRKQGVPYVRIDMYRNYADLSMDCPCYPSGMDEQAKNEVRELFSMCGRPNLADLFETINISIREIPANGVEELAASLYQIALNFGRRTARGQGAALSDAVCAST